MNLGGSGIFLLWPLQVPTDFVASNNIGLFSSSPGDQKSEIEVSAEHKVFLPDILPESFHCLFPVARDCWMPLFLATSPPLCFWHHGAFSDSTFGSSQEDPCVTLVLG